MQIAQKWGKHAGVLTIELKGIWMRMLLPTDELNMKHLIHKKCQHKSASSDLESSVIQRPHTRQNDQNNTVNHLSTECVRGLLENTAKRADTESRAVRM